MMDMTFWQQFCSSPMDSAELSDLDSSASAWSPMSSLDDQENLHDLDTQRGGSESGSPPIMHRRTSKNPVKRVQQRTAANHRERKRMKTINEAFEGLRERIPLASGDRKLSKVDTLRLAIRYINQLSDMVTACGDVDGQLTTTSEPDAAKVIIRCHGTGSPDYSGDTNGGYPLYGHSLSWTDEKQPKIGPNGRLVAKLWVPESVDPSLLPPTLETDAIHL